MPVLTVRISEKEKTDLARRAKAAGVSAGGYVRQLLHDRMIITGADLLEEFERMRGDKRLRIRGPRK